MKKVFLIILTLILAQEKKLKVITSSPDLGDIAKVIGGESVEVKSLIRGDQDPHFIEPRPSMVALLRSADCIVRTGMDLDMWFQSLLDAARNPKILFGAPCYIDASTHIQKLDVPEGKVDASMGDIHIFGNPHYWLDPMNGIVIAEQIAETFSRIMPHSSEYFYNNLNSFKNEIQKGMERWEKKLAPFKNEKIITYHSSWTYFAKRFGLKIVATVEPKPGIPPTPSHLEYLINLIRNEKIKVIVREPFHDPSGPEYLARKTGIKVIVLPSSVGGVEEVKNYISLFDYITEKLSEAFKNE